MPLSSGSARPGQLGMACKPRRPLTEGMALLWPPRRLLPWSLARGWAVHGRLPGQTHRQGVPSTADCTSQNGAAVKASLTSSVCHGAPGCPPVLDIPVLRVPYPRAFKATCPNSGSQDMAPSLSWACGLGTSSRLVGAEPSKSKIGDVPLRVLATTPLPSTPWLILPGHLARAWFLETRPVSHPPESRGSDLPVGSGPTPGTPCPCPCASPLWVFPTPVLA